MAVVEKQRLIGGVCINTGTIPSKTFREAVRRVYSRPGLEITDPSAVKTRVRPTMQQLIGHVGRVIQQELNIIHDALARNDVALVHGRASFVDSHTLRVESLEGQRLLTADHFIDEVLGCRLAINHRTDPLRSWAPPVAINQQRRIEGTRDVAPFDELEVGVVSRFAVVILHFRGIVAILDNQETSLKSAI